MKDEKAHGGCREPFGLKLLRAVEEGDDLLARAVAGGVEGRVVHAVGDALGDRPEDGVGEPLIGRHIIERIDSALGNRTVVGAEEERDDLGARAGVVRREGVIVLESDDNSVREEIRIAQRALSAEGFSRIREIRSLERTGGYTIIQGKVRGFVVTDAAASNYTENTFAVEDSFDEPSCGIAVSVAADRYAAPGRGTEVVIDLAGARLERRDGILTLSLQDNPTAGDATPLPVRPDTVTFADLATGDYESMFVCLKECQVVEDAIGGILASSPGITDESGAPLGRLIVSADSPFGSVAYARGGGRVCGIAGAVRDGICEILPTSADDVAFTAKRIGEKPGILELPYVFSFYCSSQTDGACKYINYYKLYWDPVTLLTSGKIADDKDESIGAALYVSAFASEARTGRSTIPPTMKTGTKADTIRSTILSKAVHTICSSAFRSTATFLLWPVTPFI